MTSMPAPSVARPFLVTRPAAAGRALAAALAARGVDARWLPAFALGPAPDPEQAAATLARLADFDLALFVSPAAVRATAELLGPRAWPAGTAIGAVGPGTRDAVAAHLRFAEGAAPTVIVPATAPAATEADAAEGDAATGSEAYWQAQRAHEQASGTRPRRVLVLRAEQGRDWLQARFAQAGAQVTLLAVYARRALLWSAEDASWVATRVGGVAPVLVVTSSEAVDSLCAAAMAADASGAALRWLQRGHALALHPRIVERLQAAGFAQAACVPCEVDALLAAA
jgi:uroporphyrinogen-III synthase